MGRAYTHILGFLREESAATAIEYGLIAALIAMVIVIGIQAFGTAMINMYTGNSNSIDAVINNSGS